MNCRYLKAMTLSILFICIASVPIVISGPNEHAKILLHIGAPTTKAGCGSPDAQVACSQVKTSGELYPVSHYVYMLLGDGSAADGLIGVECGIDYNPQSQAGVDVFSWATCHAVAVQFQFDSWPQPRGGLIMLWDQCHREEPGGPGTGVVFAAGYFYCSAYSPDQMRIIPRPEVTNACNDPNVEISAVASCDGTVEDLESRHIERTTCKYIEVHHKPYPLGTAAFSAGGRDSGYNPCSAPTRVQSTTWSRIKTLT
jgi:hypothetical protein